MKAEATRTRKIDDLRARAEKSVRKAAKKETMWSAEDARKAVHELQVHEIELQMQNEELRRTQLELEEACERYAHLYDFAPCGYITLTASGEIKEANLTSASMLGMERKRLVKQKFTRFIREESQDDFYLFSRLVLSSGIRQTTQLELKGGTGAQLTVRVDGIADNHPEDHQARYRISLSDITDSRRVEEALRQSEKNLSDFFDESPIGFQWLGMDGKILRANQAQLDLLGHDSSSYLGHVFNEFDCDPDVANDLLRRLATQEIIRNFRSCLKRRDGSIRHVLIDANSHLIGKQIMHFSVFSRDITGRVELEQQLLEISEREHRRIAQDLHDDLGQILTASIHLSTSLHKRLATKLLPEAAEEARILSLLDKALAQTRGLARGLHPVPAEPHGLMSALEELARRTVELFDCACHFECPQPVMVTDNITATHLYRIAQEAVTNAIKHGKPERIEIGLAQMGDRIRILVEDNGCGIPEKVSKKAGIGLRIMRYRAGMIGGSLEIEKPPSGGTAVICSIHAPNNPPPPANLTYGRENQTIPSAD